MINVFELFKNPVSKCCFHTKGHSVKEITLNCLFLGFIMTLSIVMFIIYTHLGIGIFDKNFFIKLTDLNLDYFIITVFGIEITATAILVMLLTFFGVSKVLQLDKSDADNYSLTVICQFPLALGMLLGSILIYISVPFAVLVYYTTGIFFSISMITTAIKYFDIKDEDKFSIAWTAVSVLIFLLFNAMCIGWFNFACI